MITRLVVFTLTFFLSSAVGRATDLLGIDVASAAGRTVVTVTVVFNSGEKSVALELRPYIVSGVSNEIMNTFLSRNSKNSDGQGTWLYSGVINREVGVQKPLNEAVPQAVAITLPHEELNIANGQYQLGFVAKVFAKTTLAGPASEAERISLLTPLTIGTPDLPPVGGGAPIAGENVDPQVHLNEAAIEEIRKLVKELSTSRIPFDPKRVLTAPLEKSEDANHRLIYFATNRPRFPVESGDKTGSRFRVITEQNTPTPANTFGAILVHLPHQGQESPVTGKLTRVNRWATNLDNAYYMRHEDLREEKTLIDSLWEQNVLIYIHGFNNNFEDAILQAAQFANDIQFRGKVMAFTWPSLGGGLTSYTADEKSAKASYSAAADFLDQIMLGGPNGKREMSKRGKRTVLAHSMGNRVLIYGTAELTRRKRISLGEDFGTVIFAAPDVNQKDFEKDALDVVGNAKLATLYVSKKDLALIGSEILHSLQNLHDPNTPLLNRRAGRHPTHVFGLQTITTDAVNSRFLAKGHGYFAASDRVLVDLALLINHELPPSKRHPPLNLEKVSWGGLTNLWSVAPAK